MASADDMDFLRRIGADKLRDVVKNFADLRRRVVLVGVPQINTHRDGMPITNAALAYIHEHGDASRNLPARPFLIPGIINVQAKTIAGFRRAALYALSGNKEAVTATLGRIGLTAQNAVRLKLTTGPFAPLAPLTIARRRAKMDSRQLKKADEMIAAGKSPYTPLIDTGAMRQSITYVIRERKR